MAFFTANDNLGSHFYFRTIAEAQSFQAERGGYILETTPRKIWRVTLKGDGA